MTTWPLLFAVLVGAGLTIQIGMNATLRNAIGSPLLATVVNFSVGLLVLVMLTLATGARPAAGTLSATPPWAWLGGLLGAAYVVAVTMLGPRLGAAALLGLTLFGQLVAALLVDHYGAIGFPQVPVTLPRVLGVLLLLAGALLVMRR